MDTEEPMGYADQDTVEAPAKVYRQERETPHETNEEIMELRSKLKEKEKEVNELKLAIHERDVTHSHELWGVYHAELLELRKLRCSNRANTQEAVMTVDDSRTILESKDQELAELREALYTKEGSVGLEVHRDLTRRSRDIREREENLEVVTAALKADRDANTEWTEHLRHRTTELDQWKARLRNRERYIRWRERAMELNSSSEKSDSTPGCSDVVLDNNAASGNGISRSWEAMEEVSRRAELRPYLFAPPGKDDLKCMLYTINALILCAGVGHYIPCPWSCRGGLTILFAGRPLKELWQHSEAVGVARARQRAIREGQKRGLTLYGDKTAANADFLMYMVRFTGWAAPDNEGGQSQYFEQYHWPYPGRLNLVREHGEIGHFFLMDLRRCAEAIDEDTFKKFHPVDILDSRRAEYVFNTTVSTLGYTRHSYVWLEEAKEGPSKTEVMRELMAVASIAIQTKGVDMSYFEK